jgi:nicotinate (nicotinamide) nucleotide adenylyltransferase
MSFDANRPPNWNEITAIFGGAFDPPHLGHREAVESLFRHPGVKAVRIVPTGNPALKSATTEAKHRLEMARRNFMDLSEGFSAHVVIDDRELRRDPAKPSYTYDTVQELRRELGTPLAFVVGVDQVESFDRWHRAPELLGLCHWIAIERKIEGGDTSAANDPEAPAARMAQGLKRLQSMGLLRSTSNPRLWHTTGGTALLSVPTEARALSSTQVRRDLALASAPNMRISPQIIGQVGLESLPPPPSENLHPDVESYLKANRLYGT